MKKIIFLYILLLNSCIPIPAQISKTHRPDAIMVSFQPFDIGMGVKYEHSFNSIGTYVSTSYGNWYLYKKYDLKHHIKSTIGILIPMKDYLKYKYDFTIGLNYHYIYSCGDKSIVLDPKIFKSWSFELGISVKLKHLAVAIRTDILRWEPCIDVGIPINYKRYD